MGTQLNIKSEDAYRLWPHALSELTGESLTTVVTKALRRPNWIGGAAAGKGGAGGKTLDARGPDQGATCRGRDLRP